MDQHQIWTDLIHRVSFNGCYGIRFILCHTGLTILEGLDSFQKIKLGFFLYDNLISSITPPCYHSRQFYLHVLRTVRTPAQAKRHFFICDITTIVATSQFMLRYRMLISCDITIYVVISQFILRWRN